MNAIWALALAGPIAAGGWLVFSGRLFAVAVIGRSMEPALRQGQRAFVMRRRPRRGDIVLLTDPHVRDAFVIKRLTAMPGDPIPPECAAAASLPPGSPVPDGQVILLGDNPTHSVDSRLNGPYPRDLIVGVVLTRA